MTYKQPVPSANRSSYASDVNSKSKANTKNIITVCQGTKHGLGQCFPNWGAWPKKVSVMLSSDYRGIPFRSVLFKGCSRLFEN